MSTLSRRTFLAAAATGAASAAAGIVGMTPVASAQAAAYIGRLFTLDKGAIRVHTYIAPDASFNVTSHIIETENSLVVIDTQLLQTFAREVQAIAESTGKPVNRVILSHAHPDHFLGANLYEGVPFASTQAIADGLQGYIDAGAVQQLVGILGESELPAAVRPIDSIITAGEETIDGVTFAYDILTNAEAPEHLVIRVPEAGVIVLQDLAYNSMHFFPGQDRANWISHLQATRDNLAGFDTLLVGHGLPATRGVLDNAIAYLNFVNETKAAVSSPEELVAALQAQYPGYEGAGILSFWAQYFQS